MSWWNSFETLSKLQTVLAILITILGTITVTFRLRADHLKKQSDARRSIERATLDKELREQTATAIRVTAELEERTRPKPLDDRLRDFLNGFDNGILTKLQLNNGQALTVEGDADAFQAGALRKLCAEPDAQKYITLLPPNPTANLLNVSSDGVARGPIRFVLKASLIKPTPKITP